MAATKRGWRYFATRLNGDGTETLLDMDLPLEDVGIEDVLSGDNSITGTLDPVYKRLLGPDGLPLMREWSTAVYAENDGDIRGGGILTHSDFDGPKWGLECTGFTGYGRDMPWTGGSAVTNSPSGWTIPANKDGSGVGVGVDPIDMVRVIWKQIQEQAGGNINLTFDPTTTGGKVKIGTALTTVQFQTSSGVDVSFEAGPYKLNWWSSHDLQGEVDNLAGSTPFDYHEKHYWKADGTIGHKVEIGYPKIGRRRDDLRFVFGVNIFDPVQEQLDGADYASGTMVLGSGETNTMVKSIMEPPTRPQGRLRRIAVVTDDTIKSKSNADKRAQAENQWRSHLEEISSVVVQQHPNAPLGAAQIGDEIRLEGQGDWIPIDMYVRILAISYSPTDGNQATYTVARTDKLTT